MKNVFSNLTIKTRLALGFGLIIGLLIVSAITGVTRLADLGRSVEDLASSRVPKLVASGRAVEALLQSARQMRNVLIFDDKAQVKSEIGDVRRNSQTVAQLLDQVEKMLADDVERTLFQSIVDAGAQYKPLESQFLAAAERDDYAGAKAAMLRLRAPQSIYVDALSLLIEHEAAQSQADAKNTLASQQSSRAIIVGVALLAIFLASVAAVLITHWLKARLAEAMQMAKAVAAGDLTVKVETTSGDETGQLIGALMEMRGGLADAVGTIRQSSESVRAASTQIAAANTEMSGRAEEQASTLEETAASMEELTTTVKQNADNAAHANQLAAGASDVAVRGGDVMRDVTATMAGISEASRKIADIVSMIDAIAFQTNILALNAAVEAARAGDHGRGFAVVATEVRGLAHRSAAAAKEIKQLIQNSVDRVDRGINLVEGAGKTMEEIVAAVKRVTDIMAEIATASQEQLHGIEQVGGAVIEMDRTVQQNSAIVEESAAAAENMRELAEQLTQAVARFKLDGEGQAKTAATVVPIKAPTAKRGPLSTARPAPTEERGAAAAETPKPLAKVGAAPRPKRTGGGDAVWKEF